MARRKPEQTWSVYADAAETQLIDVFTARTHEELENALAEQGVAYAATRLVLPEPVETEVE